MARLWYDIMGWTAWLAIEWAYTKLMPIDAVSGKLYGFGNWLYGVQTDYGIKRAFLKRNSHPDAGEYPHPEWIEA